MSREFSLEQVKTVFARACAALRANSDALITLDQAVGDGDLGLTAVKIADAVESFLASGLSQEDIGKFVMTAGMKINGAAPSTMGSLLAIALMQAGRLAKDKQALDEQTAVEMLHAGVKGIMDKGKASLGDKTLLDALHPAVEAWAEALGSGQTPQQAAAAMLDAAQKGMDSVTALRNKVGRASWLGERTEGKPDPGCAFVVALLKGLV